MSRLRWITIFTLILLAAQIAQPERKPRIAVIKSRDIIPFNRAIEGFKSVVDGEICEYDMSGELKNGRYIKEIIQVRGYDLIFAVGTLAAITASKIRGIPSVYCMVINPDRFGLQHKGHMTGVSARLPAQLTLAKFKEMLPTLRRIGVIYNPDKTGYLIDEAKDAADKLHLALVERPVETRRDVASSLSELWGKIDALWLLPDPVLLWEDTFRYVAAEATARGVPIFAFSRSMVKSGAFAAVLPDYRGMGIQAGWLARKILQGCSPSKLGFIQPISCRVALNVKIAKLLGIDLPKSIIENAEIFPKSEGGGE
ncbi:ABC transporter substrate-binding protein [Candidatus Poribacteria bacterium]|nr:ABC transporter substrate-binding protein [Candidatus Poribacteria bacterium]